MSATHETCSNSTAALSRGGNNNHKTRSSSASSGGYGGGGSGKRPLPDSDYPSVDPGPALTPEQHLHQHCIQHRQQQMQNHMNHNHSNHVPHHRYPSSASSTRQPSAEPGSQYTPYPPPPPPPPSALPGPVLKREMSVESGRSHSPGPETCQHVRSGSRTPPPYPVKDPGPNYPSSGAGCRESAFPVSVGGCREAGSGGYPASVESSAYPTPPPPGSRERLLQQQQQQQGEQQHLLAYRGSPTPCYQHGGVDIPGAGGPTDYPLKRQRSTRSTRSNASRRRQNEDACTTCLRGSLHCYNVCILIIGCGALGVGVWLLVTDFGARNVTPIIGTQMYEVTTYLLIAGGGAVALLAFCGCCGTIREDKCVLSFYGTTLAVVLILLGIACGLAFFFRGLISEKIQVRMEKLLVKQYGFDVRNNIENRRLTESWDAMQRQLQCCGVVGNSSSPKAWKIFSLGTEWHSLELQKKNKKTVPDSCCAKGDLHVCTGIKDFKGPPRYFGSKYPEYSLVNPYLYTTGCYDKLVVYLNTYSAVVGCVAAVVPVFLILGIIVSFCLCSRVAGIPSDEEVEL